MTDAPAAAIRARFGVEMDLPAGAEAVAPLLERRACRRFRAAPVGEAAMRLLIAAGLSAPSKSDLQQADIVWVRDGDLRAEVFRDCGDWVTGAAETLIVLGDGRRFRDLCGGDGHANDHFDALFNATGDAAIVLGQLVAAAAYLGLGACPVSVIRNRAEAVSAALSLPARVFPFAGLALGWPAEPRAPISPRLGLDATLHLDRFDAAGQGAAVARYDARRAAEAPYARQREPERWGTAGLYGWSEEKRRHYAVPQRTGWSAFLRACGFRFD